MEENTTKSYPNIAQSFGITGMVILAQFIFIPIKLLLDEVIPEEAGMFIYYVLAAGASFGLIYALRMRKTGAGSFKFTLSNWDILPFLVVGTLTILVGVISPISGLIPISESMKEMLVQFMGHDGFYSFLLLVVAAPIIEELIFRGIVLDGLLKRYSPLKSTLLSSFLFGIVHLNLIQFTTGLVLGIFMGWVYYKTKSVLATIIIHSSANLSAFVFRLFFRPEDTMNISFFESYGGQTNFILITAIALAVTTVIIYLLNIKFKAMES